MISRDDTFIDLTDLLHQQEIKRKTWKYKIRHFINIITFNILYKKYKL